MVLKMFFVVAVFILATRVSHILVEGGNLDWCSESTRAGFSNHRQTPNRPILHLPMKVKRAPKVRRAQ
jgi:hypothetical protein